MGGEEVGIPIEELDIVPVTHPQDIRAAYPSVQSRYIVAHDARQAGPAAVQARRDGRETGVSTA